VLPGNFRLFSFIGGGYDPQVEENLMTPVALIFSSSEFVFRAHVTTDKEAITPLALYV